MYKKTCFGNLFLNFNCLSVTCSVPWFQLPSGPHGSGFPLVSPLSHSPTYGNKATSAPFQSPQLHQNEPSPVTWPQFPGEGKSAEQKTQAPLSFELFIFIHFFCIKKEKA